jgi:arylsulfatase A-like enzyme
MTREENKYNNAAVRTEQWRLVFTLDKGKVQYFLSDINKDPGELNNLVDKFPEVIKELTAAYDNWWDSTKPFLVNEKLPLVPAKQQPLTIKYNKQLIEKGIPDWKPNVL